MMREKSGNRSVRVGMFFLIFAVFAEAPSTYAQDNSHRSYILVESLYLHRHASAQHRSNLPAVLEHKLEDKAVGLTIAVNQGAVDFVAREGEALLPGIPMLIPIREELPDWEGEPRILITIESRQDAEGTLRYAFDLFPETQRVLVTMGEDDHEVPFLAPFLEAQDNSPKKLHIEATADLSYVGAGSIVLLLVLVAALVRENHHLKAANREPELAEHQLRKSEFLLANSQKIARLGSWKIDVAANELIWSDETYRIFGLEPQACPATYEAFLDLVHPDDRAAVDEAYSASLREGRDSYEIEHRIVRQDTGIIRHVYEKCLNERDATGSVVRSIGMVQDISERKKAVTELCEANKRLEFLLQVSQKIASSFEQKELLQVIVDSVTEVMGIDSGAVYLLVDRDTIRLAATTPPLPAEVPEGTRVACLREHPHVRKAMKLGRHVVMPDARTATLTPAEREIVQLRDLRSNLYLPILLRGQTIGVLILSSVEKTHSFTEDGIDLLQGFANQAAQTLDNVRNFEQARKYAAELEREIAQRKRAEEAREKLQSQLNQAQKLESVGRLAGGVAHDFNNMLYVIIGHADMVLEEIGREHPFHADLTEIRKAGERSADLTRQLLAFARKQTVAPKVIDLNQAVAGLTKMLTRLIGEDIDMAWIPGEKLWPVKIDPSQIDQILANLCINARDAIADVGKVTIETGRAVFDEDYCEDHAGFLPGEFVMLAVSDNGSGMDEETRLRIFEPFFTTKELSKGTGLGLATVYGVVKQNNGFINVYTEPGQGTTFKIYLPRHLGKATPLSEKRPDEQRERGYETVLLVEDEPASLKITTKMLEREGYTVLAAGTPGEAVRLANEHSGDIHLLVTDVVMPKMNGRDLAENIVFLYPTVKCLFMSGYTANVIAHHGVLDEGVSFIQKPFSKDDLAIKVREVLEPDERD